LFNNKCNLDSREQWVQSSKKESQPSVKSIHDEIIFNNLCSAEVLQAEIFIR
jgi:hypothetical protein